MRTNIEGMDNYFFERRKKTSAWKLNPVVRGNLYRYRLKKLKVAVKWQNYEILKEEKRL